MKGEKDMFKRIILAGVSLCLILCSFISAYRTPIPILNDISDAEIVGVYYNSEYGYGNYLVRDNTEVDEQSVLKCISEYKEYNAFTLNGKVRSGYCIDDYNFMILIHSVNDGFIEVFVGDSKDKIYINNGDNAKHKIKNGSALKDELMPLIIK